MIVLCKQGKITEAATKTAGIYYWKNNLNGKGYVGQSLDILKRTSKYIGGHFSTQRAFYSAVQKYGLENFTCYKVMDCCPSKVALNYWETYWINTLDTLSPNGYNLKTGASKDGYSVETRRKMSESLRGKKRTPEQIERIRKSHIGIKHSPRTLEYRKKLSERRIGKIHSEETRRKISERLFGRRGRKVSEETRLKLSRINTGRKHSNDTLSKMRKPRSEQGKDNIRRAVLLANNTLWKYFLVYE